jgi:hypothetical protein
MGNSTTLPRWNKKKLRHIRRRIFTREAGKIYITYKIDHIGIEGKSGGYYQVNVLVNVRGVEISGVKDYSQLVVQRGGSFPWKSEEGKTIQTIERAIRSTAMLTKEIQRVARFYLDMKKHSFEVCSLKHVLLRDLTE